MLVLFQGHPLYPAHRPSKLCTEKRDKSNVSFEVRLLQTALWVHRFQLFFSPLCFWLFFVVAVVVFFTRNFQTINMYFFYKAVQPDRCKWDGARVRHVQTRMSRWFIDLLTARGRQRHQKIRGGISLDELRPSFLHERRTVKQSLAWISHLILTDAPLALLPLRFMALYKQPSPGAHFTLLLNCVWECNCVFVLCAWLIAALRHLICLSLYWCPALTGNTINARLIGARRI